MGTPGEGITVRDVAFGSVGARGLHTNLPEDMRCPNGHFVSRHAVTAASGVTIPFYPCVQCEVVFRYQECKNIEDVIGPGPVESTTVSM